MHRRTRLQHTLVAGLAAAARRWATIRSPRRWMDQPGRRLATDGCALLPAVMYHRLELAEACRAALEALDRGDEAVDAE